DLEELAVGRHEVIDRVEARLVGVLRREREEERKDHRPISATKRARVASSHACAARTCASTRVSAPARAASATSTTPGGCSPPPAPAGAIPTSVKPPSGFTLVGIAPAGAG